MADKRTRLKASDVYAQSNNPFVGKTSSFSEAFPSIESIKVVVEEYDYGHHVRSNIYTQGNFGRFIDCKNSKCYNGGFNVQDLVNSMTFSRVVEEEFEIECQGYEGSPKGRQKTDSCGHTFKVKINIVYKEM